MSLLNGLTHAAFVLFHGILAGRLADIHQFSA